jgi:hypothetical protein
VISVMKNAQLLIKTVVMILTEDRDECSKSFILFNDYFRELPV